MRMSKEEFVNRYIEDRKKKRRQVKRDVLGYYSNKRTKYLRQMQKLNRYKIK